LSRAVVIYATRPSSANASAFHVTTCTYDTVDIIATFANGRWSRSSLSFAQQKRERHGIFHALLGTCMYMSWLFSGTA